MKSEDNSSLIFLELCCIFDSAKQKRADNYYEDSPDTSTG